MKNNLLFLLFIPIFIQAQDAGYKDFPNLGISLTIPQGWVGQENESGYAMGSYTEPGIILVLPHQTPNIEQLKVEAREGIADNQGTSLILQGMIRDFSSNGIQADYQGTINFQPAKAHAVGLINPYGTGITIIAMTTAEQFSELHQNLAEEIAGSVKFVKVEVKESSSQWSELLKNARLTYMNSYSSSSGSYDGYSTGGGYSDKIQIDLCAQGYFNHSSSSSMSFDTGGGFGSAHDSGQGSGTWKVIVNASGQDVLQLKFHSGQVYEYVLALQDNKTYLDDRRYFRTYGTVADDGPDCF